MRRGIFWLGWTILCIIPIAFLMEAIRIQDVPPLAPWAIAAAIGAIVVIVARNRDDVLKHHIA